MDDETLDELAKRWCLKGIFKMGLKETAERARVDAWDLVVEVRRLRDLLAAARGDGALEMWERSRAAARAAFDAHPLTLDRYHEPRCICDAIGRGSCSECDRGDAIIAALDALSVVAPDGAS